MNYIIYYLNGIAALDSALNSRPVGDAQVHKGQVALKDISVLEIVRA